MGGVQENKRSKPDVKIKETGEISEEKKVKACNKHSRKLGDKNYMKENIRE